MRIISDFHDYYDCIQRLGQDKTIIYLRRKKVVEGWPFPTCSGTHGPSWLDTLTRTRIIGFCGKIIPLVEIQASIGSSPVLCWSIEDVDAFMREQLAQKAWSAYNSSTWTRGFVYGRRRNYFQQFFVNCEQHENSYEQLFLDHHSPVFVATTQRKYTEIVFNDCLKNVEFFRRFDNYRAFQEIEMYMGGVLGTHGGHKTKYKGELMSSEVSDHDLAAAKGFDKHSFRSSK